MKSFGKLLFISILASGIFINIFFNSVKAQAFYSPTLFGSSLYGYPSMNYGYLPGGRINPLIGGSLYGGLLGSSLLGNNFYGSPYSSIGMGLYGSFNPFSQIMQAYNYLNYCLRFYEIARQTPFFYMYDQSADYIGANLYNYAIHLDVTPQEAILYYIQENMLSPQS